MNGTNSVIFQFQCIFLQVLSRNISRLDISGEFPDEVFNPKWEKCEFYNWLLDSWEFRHFVCENLKRVFEWCFRAGLKLGKTSDIQCDLLFCTFCVLLIIFTPCHCENWAKLIDVELLVSFQWNNTWKRTDNQLQGQLISRNSLINNCDFSFTLSFRRDDSTGADWGDIIFNLIVINSWTADYLELKCFINR